jgi:serine/threonine protein kinase
VFAQGAVIAGKYRIEHKLGEGGMGTVLAATHLMLGTRVAIKVLHAEMAREHAVVERFLREGRTSAQLRSEHVCRVADVGVEGGVPYLVMELLDGRDLGSLVKAHGPMPPAMVCEYVLQACAGLAEAHAIGFVHRDLKPGNLFLTHRPDGTPLIKVLDFGVAKAPDSGNFSLTQTSSVMGSPGYMSPEQLRSSRDVDARSDVWSLGVVMFELMAGCQPFPAGSITELALRVAMDPTPALPGVPRPYAEIVEHCLEKDPARRFQDVAALASALAAILGAGAHESAAKIARMMRGVHVAMSAVPASPSAPTTLRGATGAMTGERKSRSWKLPAVIGLGLASGAIAVIVATTGGTVEEGTHVTAPAAAPSPPPPLPPPPPPPPPQPEVRGPPPDAAPAPVAPAKKPKPRPTEDVGESRF